MKKIKLLRLAVLSALALQVKAQTPIMQYDFAGGSLVNLASPGTGDLTQTVSGSSNILDRFGASNNAKLINNAKFIGGNTPNNWQTNFTISFWSKHPGLGARILQGYGLNAYGFRINAVSHNDIAYSINCNGPTLAKTFSVTNIGDNNWHHIVLRSEAINDPNSAGQLIEFKMFIDGSLINASIGTIDDPNSFAPPHFLSNASFRINAASGFYGALDDIAIYTSTLTPTQISALYNAGIVNVSSITVQGAGGSSTITTNGGTLQMNATVLPANASDQTYTWSVANGTGSATISTNGILTAQANGTVTVTATANDGSGVTGSAVITLSNQMVLINSIAVQSATGNYLINSLGGTLQMNATVLPTNATNQTVTWSIANGTGTASVSTSGLITSQSGGIVTVTATANDASGLSASKEIMLYSGTDNVMEFNAGASYVNLGNVVGTTGIKSIELWFKPAFNINNTLSTAQSLLYRYSSGNPANFGIYIGPSSWSNRAGKIVFQRNVNGVEHYIYSDNNTWDANKWYHVAATIDAGGMKLYIDGVLQQDTDPSSDIVSTGNTYPTYLGAWGNLGARHFEGKMDNIRMWSRSLTQAEVQSNNCAFLDPTQETDLEGYWTFDINSGSNDVIDLTDNGYTGSTVTNSVRVAETVYESSVDVQYGCPIGYTWIDNNTYYASNNSATYTLSNVNGCDSLVTLNLTIPIINTATNIVGNTIMVTNPQAAAYQWKDCTTNTVIVGATSPFYTPTVSGVYAVEVVYNGCVDISSCQNVTIVTLVNAITVQGQGGASAITVDNGTLQMTAAVLPSNATDATYTWSVSNGTGSATIDASGLLTAITNGTVTVSATANDASGIVGTTVITISNQSTIGIDQNVTNFDVNVFPNPTTGSITFTTDSKIDFIEVISLTGRKMGAFMNTNTIDISNLANGIYFVNISSENKKIVKRIVKQ